jgi:hypothetical protein
MRRAASAQRRARLHLRVGKHLPQRIDRPAADFKRFQLVYPLRRVPRLHHPRDELARSHLRTAAASEGERLFSLGSKVLADITPVLGSWTTPRRRATDVPPPAKDVAANTDNVITRPSKCWTGIHYRMATKGGSRTLKDQNRWQLWLIIAANAVVFYGACQWETIALSGFKSALAGTTNLLPVGLAIIVTTIANGLLSSSIKDKLVFLRWQHALPGHRAFSFHARSDPRIDFARLQRACGNKIPIDPAAENSAWYRFYLEVQEAPAVQHVHRDFLLLRDYTGLAALFLIGLGLAALFVIPTWRTFGIYFGILLLQFIIVRHAAATYGVRFVCTVLAQKVGQAKR